MAGARRTMVVSIAAVALANQEIDTMAAARSFRRCRLWPPVPAVWPRVLIGLAVAAATPAQAADCDATTAQTHGPYKATCADKGECLISDILDIKPTDNKALPLKTVCLLVGVSGGTASATNSFADTIYKGPDAAASAPASAASAVAIAQGLAGRVARWLHEDDKRTVLQTAAKPPLTVVMVDSADKRFKADLVLDLGSAWAAGDLLPVIGEPKCQPCNIGGEVVLQVSNLAAWKAGTHGDASKLSLMLNGVKMPGLTPSDAAAPDWTLRYRLTRAADKADNAGAWAQVLPEALAGDGTLTVGLGNDKGALVNAVKAATFEGSLHRQGYAFGGSLMVLVLLAAILRFSHGNWLRDDYTLPAGAVPAGWRMPYSLAYSQMLWWTLVIVVSWMLIGASTGDWFAVTTTMVLLMGLGAGTTLGSKAVGVPKKLQDAMDAYNKAVKANATLPADIAETKEALQKLVTPSPRRFLGGWLADVTSNYNDDTGLHRVQLIHFALAFGGWALYRAYREGALPDLSTPQLGLLGISATGYVGFKVVGSDNK